MRTLLCALLFTACGHRSAGDDSGGPPERDDTRRITTPPGYLGSDGNSRECDRPFTTVGFEPVSDGLHPLFLYFVGTQFGDDDASTAIDSSAPLWVTDTMAQRGFVSLSVGYDNGASAWLSDHENQMACLFESTKKDSLITRACQLPNVDCALGIVTWGHSQGGYVAANAHDVEPRVRAAWATGYGGDGEPTIDRSRLRVVNGEGEGKNADEGLLNDIFGTSCTGVSSCLDDAGAGWRIVRKSDLATVDEIKPSADHCWFDRRECVDKRIVLEPTWIDGEADYSIAKSADWLTSRL